MNKEYNKFIKKLILGETLYFYYTFIIPKTWKFRERKGERLIFWKSLKFPDLPSPFSFSNPHISKLQSAYITYFKQ